MTDSSTTILIGGEAGQGLATVGQILSRCCVRAGYHLVVTQGYMSRIRGGHNTFTVRVSTEDICSPSDGVNVLIALDHKTVDLHKGETVKQGVVVVDEKYDGEDDRILKVPFGELGTKRSANIVAIGVVTTILGIDKNIAGKVVEDAFGKKGPDVERRNRETLDGTFKWAAVELFA